MSKRTTSDEVMVTSENGVTTLTMNRPEKLNAWTQSMRDTLTDKMRKVAVDDATKVAIITGRGKFYSSGGSFGGLFATMSPAALHAEIVRMNVSFFEAFIEFPKPIIVAANGPAVGGVVTSATLCDAIIASDTATFSTPFSALGLVPEGCSSVHFERIMRGGRADAERMLGPEGWKPTAKEAKEAGLVSEVVPYDQVRIRSQQLGEEWIASGRKRWMVEKDCVEEYRAINRAESARLADVILAPPFLRGQYNFLRKKGKTGPAMTFWTILKLRPFWSRYLPK